MEHWTRAARVVQPELVSFGPNNRVRQFTRYLVGNQSADGGWKFQYTSALNSNNDNVAGAEVRAAWAVITLSSDRSVAPTAVNPLAN